MSLRRDGGSSTYTKYISDTFRALSYMKRHTVKNTFSCVTPRTAPCRETFSTNCIVLLPDIPGAISDAKLNQEKKTRKKTP